MSVENPFSLPLPNGTTFDMTIVTQYTLTAMNGNVAELDIVQDYVAKNSFGIEAVKSGVKGTGKGKIKYDITGTQFLDYVIETNMQMEMEMDVRGETMKIGVDSNSTTRQQILN